MTRADDCFHCALPVPDGCDLHVEIGDSPRPVCCPGCKAVAELIRDAGHASFYRTRETPQPGSIRPESEPGEWGRFDGDDMVAAFSRGDGERRVATLHVGGMYCSACGWLVESTLSAVPGVEAADVNPLTHRVRVRWDPRRTGFGTLLGALADLGYKPRPVAPGSDERPERDEQRLALKRLLVASIGMMQVMMFAVALYSGEFQGIDASMERFLRVVSFLVTTPVVFYAARPFFAGAWRGVRTRRPGMDLPVSIAIGSAYVASVYMTATDGPAVWFDSVTMFVFFLTVARYLEMRARHRSIEHGTALSSLLPDAVTRLEHGKPVVIPAERIAAGDRLLVRAGDAVPADGVIVDGMTSVDESVLTGESRPKRKSTGDRIVAGSVNIDGVIRMRVEATGSGTAIGLIERLAERARYARPAIVHLADRIASYFVVAILSLAVIVAATWYVVDSSRAFVVTLSVLVVTCPCALALATPAAFAAAASRLAELRLLVTNADAIETLARATTIVFDKTGTLTAGRPAILSTKVLDRRYTRDDVHRIAAALERASSHPIARAFATGPGEIDVQHPKVVVGAGVTGTIDGTRWLLGSRELVGDTSGDSPGPATTRVYLAAADRIAAVFEIDDPIRPDARNTLSELQKLGLSTSLLSGDTPSPVARIANVLDIGDARAGCRPDDKLENIRARQASGEVVVMVGDGINDAPVLAGADASIAPAHAASLARTRADILMLGERLQPVVTAVRAARRTMRIVRQNLAWAIAYNLTAVPLAALGFVPPWLAAAGMSASSLVVVLNALRLSRFE